MVGALETGPSNAAWHASEEQRCPSCITLKLSTQRKRVFGRKWIVTLLLVCVSTLFERTMAVFCDTVACNNNCGDYMQPFTN